MAKGIVIDIGRCTGCGYCELICSFTHHGEFNPLKSRIHSSVFIDKSMAVPVVCYQCEDPWCAKNCPAGAISIDKDPGGAVSVVTVHKDKCVGCKMCTLACPFGCIVVSDSYAEKCDLCGGDPQCVKVCRSGAIRFEEAHTSVAAKRKSVAERLLGSYQEE
ncbi:MAG: 4Fe-4S dicluster domain-containing protein [Desulfobacteraceae bacterium]|nr:MAG: 4Fe-4S dicluster domain-containing protein [Desulfobacteraceae bacterium]